MPFLFLALSMLNSANAVPLQLTQQGRILDSSGASITGTQSVTFNIYDDATTGTLLWTETLTVAFNNGYYATVLGSDEVSNPLDSDTLSQHPIYLELQLGSNSPMSPRHPINSAPYAQMSGVSESVDGGSVNATDVSISSTPVIDSGGNWVGQPIIADWNNLTSIPSYITDGDDNTQLTETEVENYVTNGGVSLHEDTTLDGEVILTDPGSCSDGDVMLYHLTSGTWGCGTDTDTTLTATEVQAMVESVSALALQAGATVDGSPIVTEDSTLNPTKIDATGSTSGQVLTSDGSTVSWADAASSSSGEYYLGNITFSTSSAMTYFCQNYTGIYGNVTISGSNISHIDELSCLTFIDGNLVIETSGITNVDGLSNVTAITGGITLDNNSALVNIDGLSNVSSVGKDILGRSLYVNVNASLSSLAGFSGLTSLSGSIRLYDNDALPNLTGLSSIVSIGIDNDSYSLQIENNSALVDLGSFTSLSSVDGHILIQSNNITSISGFNALTTADRIVIRYNSYLDSISGFAAVTEMSDYLEIEYNGIWGSKGDGGAMSGFASLVTIDGDCKVAYSDFNDISGFGALETVNGYFSIYDNDHLSSISGYNSLNYLGDTVQIEQNLILPQSEVTSLINRVGTIVGSLNLCCNN
ncbi:MAG: hypothetical protein VX278_06720 [Myxococcota bacterium]|nr:hypothetical protein [Myxococcota bacterium]